MYLNLSFYFNPLCHFQFISRSLSSHCCYYLATRSHNSVQLLFHSFPFPHTPLSLQLVNKIAPFRPFWTISFATCLLLNHFLISTPFILFCPSQLSLDVFHSLPSNHTNQIASQHVICCPFCSKLISYLLSSLFPSKSFAILSILPTSAALHSTISTFYFPTFPYFHFNYFMLLLFNNVLMFNLSFYLAGQPSNQQQFNNQKPVPAHNTIDLASSKSIPKYTRHSPSLFAFPISSSGSRRNFDNLDYKSFQLTPHTFPLFIL